MTPDRFFLVALPRLIADNLERFAPLQGTIAFAVKGAGKWTLRLGDVERPVVAGMQDGADLRLYFTPGAFQAFTSGDPAPLRETGQFTHRGDVRLLERLGYLFTTPKSPLATRLGT
jgi:hypothetical protein